MQAQMERQPWEWNAAEFGWLSITQAPQFLACEQASRSRINSQATQFCAGISSCHFADVQYPVSTCSAESSFKGMKRLKTLLRSTMSEERLTYKQHKLQNT